MEAKYGPIHAKAIVESTSMASAPSSQKRTQADFDLLGLPVDDNNVDAPSLSSFTFHLSNTPRLADADQISSAMAPQKRDTKRRREEEPLADDADFGDDVQAMLQQLTEVAKANSDLSSSSNSRFLKFSNPQSDAFVGDEKADKFNFFGRSGDNSATSENATDQLRIRNDNRTKKRKIDIDLEGDDMDESGPSSSLNLDSLRPKEKTLQLPTLASNPNVNSPSIISSKNKKDAPMKEIFEQSYRTLAQSHAADDVDAWLAEVGGESILTPNSLPPPNQNQNQNMRSIDPTPSTNPGQDDEDKMEVDLF